MKLPEGHQAIMPYLILNGAQQFMDFTKTVFNSEVTFSQLGEGGKIGHSEIQISGSTIMFSETTEKWKEQTANLFIYVADADKTFHKAIASGGEVILPLRTEEYGRTCGVKDPVGNIWWITSVVEE